MKTKTFMCPKCDEEVECEPQDIKEGYGDEGGDCGIGYFCPKCDFEFDERDLEDEYDKWRDEQ